MLVTGAKAGLGRATAAGPGAARRHRADGRPRPRGRRAGRGRDRGRGPGRSSSSTSRRQLARGRARLRRGLRGPAARARPQRRRDAAAARGHGDGHTSDARHARARPAPADQLAARAPGARGARDLGRLRRHVQAAAARRRPRVRAAATYKPSTATPAPSAPRSCCRSVGAGAARGRRGRARDAPRLGRHAAAWRASLPGFSRLTRPILRTNEQGADTIVWLAAADAPGRSSGRFWHDRRRAPAALLGPHQGGRGRPPRALGRVRAAHRPRAAIARPT